MRQTSVILLCFVLASASGSAEEQWAQWRGPKRDGIGNEKGLLKDWKSAPKLLWTYENAGVGYSGPAIVDGKLYIMGTKNESEVLISLDANTGKELWTLTLGDVFGNNWGDGPRSTPAVDGDRVYALSGSGDLVCASVSDGKAIWKKNMSQFGGSVPFWGYTESVLVDGDQLICTAAGSNGGMLALNKKSGDVIWHSKLGTDGNHYSSVVPAKLNGVPQYVQLTMNEIQGVSAKDGKRLWSSPWPGKTAVIPTPIIKENVVYVTAGYGVGCSAVRIGPGNAVEVLYENKVMKNHHGGVVLIGDHVYGFSDGAGWVCQNLLTGESVWNERGVGKGAIGYADGMFYCQSEESGDVALIEASSAGWKQHGLLTLSAKSGIRKPAGRIWTHPVILNGKLYLRDQDLVYCYDVKKSS